MKVILVCDSVLIKERLHKILIDIPDLEMAAITDNIEEAVLLTESRKPEIVVLAFQKTDQTKLDTITHLRRLEFGPLLLVVGNDLTRENHSRWKTAGAHHVYDSFIQLPRMVDLLCKLLYDHKLEIIHNQIGIKNNHDSDLSFLKKSKIKFSFSNNT